MGSLCKWLIGCVVATGLLLPVQVHSDDKPITLLFVQSAESAVADPNTKSLRLVNVNPQTVYFTDRPYRAAGHITLQTYLRAWEGGEDSFAASPPNAALSVVGDGGVQNDLVVIELFDPTFDGSDLIYRYEVLDGDVPLQGGPAALFIDTIGPGGGVGHGYHGVGVGRRGPGVAGWAGVAVRSSSDSDSEETQENK